MGAQQALGRHFSLVETLSTGHRGCCGKVGRPLGGTSASTIRLGGELEHPHTHLFQLLLYQDFVCLFRFQLFDMSPDNLKPEQSHADTHPEGPPGTMSRPWSSQQVPRCPSWPTPEAISGVWWNCVFCPCLFLPKLGRFLGQHIKPCGQLPTVERLAQCTLQPASCSVLRFRALGGAAQWCRRNFMNL